jgi:hypothetical protein
MKKLLLFILLLIFIIPNASIAENFLKPECKEENCGYNLIKNGWIKIADCNDGHQWSYIIQKENEQKICVGINARSGPTESPCKVFTGNIEKFKENALLAKEQTVAYNRIHKSRDVNDFNKENKEWANYLKEHKPVACWPSF